MAASQAQLAWELIYHNCGLKNDGAAYCWGYWRYGILGDGDTSAHDAANPTAVIGSQRFTSISLGASHTCGLKMGGSAFCWGSGYRGKLGDGDTSAHDVGTATKVIGDQTFTQIAAGGEHTCGIKADGSVYCWGYGEFGTLGDGNTADHGVATPSLIP